MFTEEVAKHEDLLYFLIKSPIPFSNLAAILAIKFEIGFHFQSILHYISTSEQHIVTQETITMFVISIFQMKPSLK